MEFLVILNNSTMGRSHLRALKFCIRESPNQDTPLTPIPVSQLLYGRKDNPLVKNYSLFLVASSDNYRFHLSKLSLPIAPSTLDRLRLPYCLVGSYWIGSPTSFLNYLDSSLTSSLPVIGPNGPLLTVL